MENKIANTASFTRTSERLTNARTRRRRVRRLLAVLGVMAVLVTAFSLMAPAISMTRGDLVCGLEEHSHSASCYENVLVCGQEEGEGADEDGEGGHVHTKDCYEKQLICEIPEHKHSDACYEQANDDDGAEGDASDTAGDGSAADSDDVGKSEGNSDDTGADSTEASDDADADGAKVSDGAEATGDAKPSGSASSVGTVEAGSGSGMPAQSFKADLKDKRGKVTLTVEVEAPEGAFPAGTFMKIDGVAPKDVADAVKEAVRKSEGAGVRVKSMTAVDIMFREGGPDGKQIEPAKKVQVKITSPDVRDFDDPMLVHVVDKSRESAKGKTDDAEVVDKVKIVNRDEGDKSTGSEDTMKFKSREFSPYVIVELEELSTQVITAGGDAYDVKVTYGPDADIPEGAQLEVREIAEGDEGYDGYVSQVADELGAEPAFARLFDITILDVNGGEVQPAAPVEVQIALDDANELTEDVKVAHFADDSDDVEMLSANLSGDTVTFDAEGFSVYAVVDGSTGDEARMTVEFYGKDQTAPPTTMYVKNGDTREALDEILYDPGAGELDHGEVFIGWILDKPDYTTADLGDVKTIDEIRDWADSYSITEGETHRLYAAICKLYKVTYKEYDEEDRTKSTILGVDTIPVKASEYGTDSAQIDHTVRMAYSPRDDVHNFEGWILEESAIPNVTSVIPEDRIYQNGDPITIKGDVSFEVNAPKGNWLVFDENGKGGTYNAPQFVKHGEITVDPGSDSMLRNGYTFGGWYKSVTGEADDHGYKPVDESQPFEFGQELTEKTTIYAKWEPKDKAPYTVVFWGQNLERTGYEVLGSYTNENGTVGVSIPYTSVDNRDEDYATGFGNSGQGHYTGYCLTEASKNQQITITPEGDAVLNLYYDRIVYNFKFYLYRNGTQNNRYDYANNSGNGSALNDLVTWHSNQTQHPSVNGYTIQSEIVGGRTYYYFVMQAYYGEEISAKWPKYDQITGANGREAVSFVMMVGTKLKPRPSSGGDGTVKGVITVMDENILGATNDSNGNYVVIRFPDNYYNWRYHIWLETVDGEDYSGKTTREWNGKTYYEHDVQTVRSSNTTVTNQNAPKYEGFDFVDWQGQNWNNRNYWTTGNNPTLYHINDVYDRQKFTISYFDGNYVDGGGSQIQNRASNLLHESDPIPHGKTIADEYKNYTPEAPEEGYVFEGWYLDEACTVKYEWGTMPIGGIVVYAKWRQVEYRVFLHPNAGADPDPLDWGSESVSTSFRVSYRSKVSTPTGKRPGTGYEFVGWYTDPSCSSQYLYKPDTLLNDETVITPYDQTDNTELDQWGNVEAGKDGVNSDRNNGRFWITRKLDLYAKWRKILEGADGINVAYTADDGQGNVGTNAPEDEFSYPDQSDVTAQAASTAPSGLEFKCWVIQKWDEDSNRYIDTDEKVVPGEHFIVREEYSHKKLVPGEEDEYTYTMQLRAEYSEPEPGLPTHIWWFQNDVDVGVTHNAMQEDNDLKINEAIAIPSAPTREGYAFLGWARVNSGDSRSSKTGEHAQAIGLNLNDGNLYLTYHQPEQGGNGYYTAVVDGEDKTVTRVAADEVTPYHDMYAVWVKTYTVTVQKVVESDFAADKDVEFNFTATNVDGIFKLKDGDEKLIKDVPENSTFSVEEEENDSFTTTIAGTYTDAQDQKQDVVFDASGNFTVLGDTTIVVTNKRKAFYVTFAKTDLDGGALYGAMFELFRYDGSTYALYSDEFQVGTDTTNTVTKGLIEGDYKLVETVPPDGYILESAETFFTVGVDGAITNLQCEKIMKPDGTRIPIAELSGSSESGYTITVRNQPGKPLPNTGGMGTLPLMMLGSLLVVGAAALLVAQRRPLAALSREWAYINARNVMGKKVHERKGFTRIVSPRKNGRMR